VESSLFDEGLSWGAATELCAAIGCQGIVALEAFDSDSHMDTKVEREKYKDDEGNWHSKAVHKAQRTTRVLAAWRLYDVEGHRSSTTCGTTPSTTPGPAAATARARPGASSRPSTTR
jgi:hypothetical protein